MLGIKLILCSLFFAIISSNPNITDGVWVLIFWGIGLAFLISGLLVKDKKNTKE